MQFEGWRCLWRIGTGALLVLALPVVAVGGAVAGYYIVSGGGLPSVIIGSAVTLCSTVGATWLWRRAPWWHLVQRRLATFEAASPWTDTQLLVRSDVDLEGLFGALRRAHFNPYTSRHVGSPPPDAADLDVLVAVQEPSRWAKSSSDEDRIERLRALLSGLGIRARVGGVDIGGEHRQLAA
jgi:hypothetical protein